MNDLSIVIVNHNLSNEIIACIKSLSKCLMGLKYEIIIVDNNSQNTEKEFLNEFIQQSKNAFLKITFLDRNLGFGTACNIGAKISESKYLCFINPDTVITSNIFPVLLNVLDSNQNYASIGIHQITKMIKSKFSYGLFPSIGQELCEVFFIGKLYQKIVNLKRGHYKNKYYEVDWISGAFFLIKRGIFDRVNGFDEEFFMYYEDMDLCWRIKQANYSILFVPDLTYEHTMSVAGKKNYYLFTQMVYKSKYLFFVKNTVGIKKGILLLLLYSQVITQITFWFLAMPFFPVKSSQKVRAFFQFILKRIFS